MALTQEDLDKIKAVVDARADLTDARVDRLQVDVNSVKADVNGIKQVLPTLTTKADLASLRTMLEGDHKAVVEDVELLKVQVKELQAHNA